MAELNSNEESHVLPPKRKQTSQNPDEDSTKKLRPDNEPPADVEDKDIKANGGKDEIEDEEEEEDYEGEDEVDSDDEDEEDDDEDEHSNGGAIIDRKGKGKMNDDKGKGKMIEESEDDDSSDEDGGAGESDGDDDFSDDPLEEVDLDNILPSRTRRRTAPQGVRISSDELTDDKDNDA
ncbi:hypothetical protein R6Q57_026736 [Mikania cordata]